MTVKTAVHPSRENGHFDSACDLDLGQCFEQFLAVRNGARLVDLGIAHDALRIEHIGRALVHAAFVVKHAVGFTDRAMRPVIGEQRKRQPAELFGPRFKAGNGICADLQNFNV